ncbi:MAG: ABC transporter ATP-binding protein [Elusimicrobiota bacterium]
MVTIETRGLAKALGGRKVLRDVNFSLEAGKAACLVGANGSGKTTFLKILAAVLLPDAGTVRILDHELQYAPAWIRGNVGWHGGEERSMYARLTCRQNYQFFGALYGLFGERLAASVESAAGLLGLSDLDRPYQELSAGMKQRALMARAMLHDPPVLLLDEPTKSLDPLAAERFLQDTVLPAARQANKTVLMATHRLEEAELIADEIWLLADGKLARASSRSRRDVLKLLKMSGREQAS